MSHLVAVEEIVEALKEDAEFLLESAHRGCLVHFDMPAAFVPVMMVLWVSQL